METATPHPLLVIAVVEDNPADVYCIARVLHAHGLQYVLQVLESSQRTLHFLGTHLRRDTVIPQWLQASKAAAASDGHAVHC